MYHGHRAQKPAEHFPAILALHLAASDGDDKADQRGELDDGGEVHEEAACPPHGAKIFIVAETVLLVVGEGPARFTGQGGVAIMM